MSAISIFSNFKMTKQGRKQVGHLIFVYIRLYSNIQMRIFEFIRIAAICGAVTIRVYRGSPSSEMCTSYCCRVLRCALSSELLSQSSEMHTKF